MALDFPSSPTNGQQFTSPDGVVWSWDGAKWTNATPGQVTGYGNVGRNLIHNSMFNVAQRGAGQFTASGSYTLDRWIISLVLDTVGIGQANMGDAGRTQIGDGQADTFLFNNFTGNAGATAYNTIQQPIEGVRRLAGKTVILSFWANCASGALKLGVNYLQTFTVGSQFWANATGQSVTLSTTWTRYSIVTTLPSADGKTVGTPNYTAVAFAFSSGATNNALFGNIGVQSGTINIWGVQLEIGSVATPLEKPDPQVELANCQRFYQVGQILAGTYAPAGVPVYQGQGLVVSMRGNPTAVVTLNSSAGLSGQTITADGLKVFLTATTAAAGTYIFNANYSLSADL